MPRPHPPGCSTHRQGKTLRRWLWPCALAAAGGVAAGSLEISEFTVDGGGDYSDGSRFAVEGSIGQTDTATLQGSRFAIDGGFWRPAAAATDAIFQDSFED
ncbi:MAG: hypothetical protein IT479_09185 [Xanthomonadales bacterium]|nr:hypothetical protein [Xanthomonadales bacterium]MCC6593437.1 hypothetical protein [Xanthomonadales bacterium]MCE7931311.1 hypothetical protein [Xanthomonadales bacterium PRO6]